jgi:HK97 family phage prohead protease
MVSGVALRAGEGDGGDASGPIMEGHFAVFGQWTEINSWEGNFLEQFVPGAFKKTISENRASMKVLFQHGYDYLIGDKPLGPIADLREDDEGVYYEVPLLDAGYVREEVQPGLEAGLYGASFRFRVIREEIDEEPGVSDHNPHGIPERKVKEAQVPEFGPVTFPAYEGASAGLRSLEAGELVAQAALERMRRDDSLRAHNLAARFAARDDGYDTSRDETEETEETAAEEESVETEVNETEETVPASDDAAESPDAPPEGSAEAEPHPDSGRRDKGRLYGGSTVPSWRLS